MLKEILAGLGLIAMSHVTAAQAQDDVLTGPVCQWAINRCSNGGYQQYGYASSGACFDELIAGATCPEPEDPQSDYGRWYFDGPGTRCASRLCHQSPDWGG